MTIESMQRVFQTTLFLFLASAVDHILSSNMPKNVGVPDEFNQNIFDVFDKITIFHYKQTFQMTKVRNQLKSHMRNAKKKQYLQKLL